LPVPMNFRRHEAPRLIDLPPFEPLHRSWAARFWDAKWDLAGLSAWLIGALAGSYLAGVRALRACAPTQRQWDD
jgi:hypothetical protein